MGIYQSGACTFVDKWFFPNGDYPMVVICGGGPCIPRVHISYSNLTVSGLVLSFFLSNNGHFLW